MTKHLFHIILFIIVFKTSVFSINTITINNNSISKNISSKCEVLVDKNKNLNIHNIKKSDSFKKLTLKNNKIGFTDANIWIRFSIKNNSFSKIQTYLQTNNIFINSVILYKNKNKKLIKLKQLGTNYLFSKRDIKEKKISIPLSINGYSKNEYYLKINTNYYLTLDFSLFSFNDLIIRSSKENNYLYIFFGALLLLLMYNVCLFIYIKSKSYFYFVALLISFILFLFSFHGFAIIHFGSNSLWFTNHCIVLFFNIYIIFLIKFSESFLEADKYATKYKSVINVFLIIISIYIILSSILEFSTLYIAVTITFPLLAIFLIYLSILIYNNEHKPAFFYIIGIILLLISLTLMQLQFFAVIGNSNLLLFIELFTCIFSIIMFSLGLTDRINYMKKELETSKFVIN